MTTPPTPTTLVARSPQDVLAAVPIVLGFVPRDSVVMLTFGATEAFHARLDLPPPDAVGEAVAALLEPARQHRVRRVVFVLYSGDERLARRVCRDLVAAFERSGIGVLEALRADGSRWFGLLPGRRGVPAWGVPYDVSAHPFSAQAVLEGKVTHRSRQELAATLARVPERVSALAALVPDRPIEGGQLAAEAAWAAGVVAGHVGNATSPPDDVAARLLAALPATEVRDAVLSRLTRATAKRHVELWTDLVRRSPDRLLPAAAGVLGLAAWLAGHGALAWCAVDACTGIDPQHTLAEVVARLLVDAVPPSVWDAQEGLSAALVDPA